MLKVDLIDDLALEHLGNIGIDFEKFARAIESAATAPLLARIAELEKWQAEHWNALEIINNYFVSKDLLLVVEDGGPDAAARNIVHSVAALEQQLEEARKDAERYRFIRDADRSDCISLELSLYAMDSLDECVDAAMEGEAELAIRAAIKEQT